MMMTTKIAIRMSIILRIWILKHLTKHAVTLIQLMKDLRPTFPDMLLPRTNVKTSAVLNTALDVKHIAATANREDDLIVEKMELVNLNDKMKKNGASPMVSVDKFIAEFNEQFDENAENTLLLNEAPGEEFEVPAELQEDNSTAPNSSIALDTTSTTTAVANCSIGKLGLGIPVELVNGSRLISLLKAELNASKRLEAGDCVVVLFYATYCPFSSMAAPHFNALARAFPDIRMVALNAMKFHSFNTQYGVVGVPSLILFHNGRPVAKFNDSEYNLEMFSKFLSKYTGLEPQEKLFITSADFAGPLPSAPLKETDYCLVLAWVFILVCGVYFFTKSLWWRWIVETIQNTWREAEAQHEHEQ